MKITRNYGNHSRAVAGRRIGANHSRAVAGRRIGVNHSRAVAGPGVIARGKMAASHSRMPAASSSAPTTRVPSPPVT